jgi:O-antigen ligase
MAIPIFVDLLKHQQRLNYRALVWLPFLIYALITTIHRSRDNKWLLETAARFLICIIFSAAVALYAEGKRIVVALGWATVPVVVYGLYQLVVGGLGPLYGFMSGTSSEAALNTEEALWLEGRAYGFFPHPNTMGAFCAVVAVALLALAVRAKEPRESMRCYVLAAVSGVGLLATGSRGALMGLVIAVLVIISLSGRKGMMRIAFGLVIFAVAFVIAKQFDLLPVGRESGGIDDFTKEGRLLVWGQAVLLFLQHPWIGNGWLNFHELGVLGDTHFGSVVHAHNWYLNTLAESGLVGFVLLFGPLLWLFVRNLRMARHNLTAFLVSVTLIVVLIHNLVDVTTTTPQFGLLLAGLIGLAAQARSKEIDTDGMDSSANNAHESLA